MFADGDIAVNVAAFSALLRDLDVTDDYPGFVVDEYLGTARGDYRRTGTFETARGGDISLR